MGHDDRREIFERLEALERMLASRHDDRGWRRDECRGGGRRHHHHHHHEHDCGHDEERGNDFEEKRIIDTIVRLVSEHVGRMLEEHREAAAAQHEGGDEKRVVDLIVRCVSEHVQEIVATELDRRLGRPKLERGDAGPGTPESEPA